MADGASDVGVGLSSVAQRYAAALYELASESGSVDRTSADLAGIAALIEGNADLKRLVMSPVFSAQEQIGAMGAILEKAGIAGLSGNFIRMVAARRRLFALPEMIRAFQAEVARARGIVSASVTLAEQPSDRQIDDIKAALRDVAGKEVAVDMKIDPSIIGGIIVKMGSRMLDASLKTKLNSIRTAMKEVG